MRIVFPSIGLSRIVRLIALSLVIGTGLLAQKDDIPLASLNQLGYAIDRWHNTDGFPGVSIQAACEDEDGYLWVSLTNGIYRFDGAKLSFVSNFSNKETQIRNPRYLFKDKEGHIWGINSQGVLFQILTGEGKIRTNTDIPGCPERVANAGISEAGDVWILKGPQRREILIYEDGAFKSLVKLDAPNPVLGVGIDANGFIWATVNRSRGLWKFSPEGEGLDHLFKDKRILKFWKTKDSRLAIALEDQLYELNADQWSSMGESEFLSANMRGIYTHFAQDAAGNTWAAIDQGGVVLMTTQGGRWRIDEPILRRENIQNLFVNQHDELWLCTQVGLYRIRPVPVQNWMDVDYLNEKTIDSLTRDSEGRLWTGGVSKLIYFDPDTQMFNYESLVAETPFHRVKTLQDGSKLLADDFGHLWHYRKGQLEKFDFQLPVIKRIFEFGGSAYLGTFNGLWKLEGKNAVKIDIPTEAPRFEVKDYFVDNEQALWVLNRLHELVRFTSSGWETMIPYQQASTTLHSIVPNDQGGLYIGSQLGLLHFSDGNLKRIQDREGHLSNGFSAMELCSNGFVWAISNRRVIQFERASLDALTEGKTDALKVRIFSEKDGIPINSYHISVEGLNVLENGDVWVCSRLGIARIRSEVAKRFHQTPHFEIKTRISSVWVNREEKEAYVQDVPATPLTIKPNQYHLEIQYSALGLPVAETTEFTHRMVGLHDEWSEPGLERFAVYEFLPAGSYRFEVKPIAQVGDAPVASLAIQVLPDWWATLWFKVLSVLLLLCLVTLVWLRQHQRQIRVAARRENFTRGLLDAQEGERKRIANELHDGLGQNLLIAKNQIYLLQQMNLEADARDKLEEVADNVTQAVDETRAISYKLRPYQLERLGLTKALQAIVKQTASSTHIPIQSDIDDLDGRFPSEYEISIYRIVQEGISNIVRHADASEVELRIQVQADQVLIRLEDDGRGFEGAAVLGEGNTGDGMGLKSFQERIRLMNGQFDCHTRPGAGTVLIFQIPFVN